MSAYTQLQILTIWELYEWSNECFGPILPFRHEIRNFGVGFAGRKGRNGATIPFLVCGRSVLKPSARAY